MKLKTILSVSLLVLFLMNSVQKVNGQAAIIALIFGDKVATESFNISMELGASFSQYSNLANTQQNKFGLNFGIAGNIKLSKNWFLSPTVYFVSKRKLSADNFSLNTGNVELDQQFINKSADLGFSYIDVPILLAYQTNNNKFRFGVAPQVSFLQNSEIEKISGDEFDKGTEKTEGAEKTE